MTTITSGIYGHGSFGLSAGAPDGVLRVWFCNRGVRARYGWHQDPCVHRTRADARACGRHVGQKGTPCPGPGCAPATAASAAPDRCPR